MDDDNKIQLRRLKASDVFLMSKIISKIGINEFSECFQKAEIKELITKALIKTENDGNDENSDNILDTTAEDASLIVGAGVMLEVANIILKNIHKCEKEIYNMLGKLSNKTSEEIEDLDFVVFSELIVDFVSKEEFKDFMKVASRFRR